MDEFIKRQGTGYPFIIIKQAEEENVYLGNTPTLKKVSSRGILQLLRFTYLRQLRFKDCLFLKFLTICNKNSYGYIHSDL